MSECRPRVDGTPTTCLVDVVGQDADEAELARESRAGRGARRHGQRRLRAAPSVQLADGRLDRDPLGRVLEAGVVVLVAHRVRHDVDRGAVAGAGLHLALGDGDGALAVPAAHDFRGNGHFELDVGGHLGRDLDAADLVELGGTGVQDLVPARWRVARARSPRARHSSIAWMRKHLSRERSPRVHHPSGLPDDGRLNR